MAYAIVGPLTKGDIIAAPCSLGDHSTLTGVVSATYSSANTRTGKPRSFSHSAPPRLSYGITSVHNYRNLSTRTGCPYSSEPSSYTTPPAIGGTTNGIGHTTTSILTKEHTVLGPATAYYGESTGTTEANPYY